MIPARAWAHCGNRQIAYARAGNGPTLILLTTATLDDLVRAPAAEPARSFRLIRPELSDLANQPMLCASCLSGFLDALGAASVIVVADPQYGSAVQQLAQAEPDRIARVIVLPAVLAAAGIHALFESLGAEAQP